jgi:hypothetical protein
LINVTEGAQKLRLKNLQRIHMRSKKEPFFDPNYCMNGQEYPWLESLSIGLDTESVPKNYKQLRATKDFFCIKRPSVEELTVKFARRPFGDTFVKPLRVHTGMTFSPTTRVSRNLL